MLRCLNCWLRVQRIQRHVVTTLPQELLIILSIWLRIEYLPMQDVLCHACYVLIQNADVNTPRTLSHTNVCAGCGCSLNEARLHFLEENKPLYEYFLWIRSIQVKQAQSYYGEHVRKNGSYEIEVCPELEHSEEMVAAVGGYRPYF
ncbi:uncharacterized protein LOC111355607 isoform X1 [Spodoptera litura]|uniref:Uncharacterized protein LOC111355607 isoform X1 n=1 Tax=Spodoptera litura TaxID=69820 RepID=A0A9J7IUD4_SPOLT|nr:uncharacterized protein LOC111355607 isoform X1 [Spodoptera litura]